MELIQIHEHPKLDQPILIAGFDGWPNAGKISTDVLDFLKNNLPTKKFAEIDPDPFCHFAHMRPCAEISDGKINKLCFCPYEFFYVQGTSSPDLILFCGSEPDLQWKRFTQSFFNLATSVAVKLLIIIGGTYDSVSHNHEPIVSVISTSNNLRASLAGEGVTISNYQGPISIHTMLFMEAERRGIPCLSFWGHAPQYLQSNNLSVIYKILTLVDRIGEINLDIGSLHLQAMELRKQINIIVENNPELKGFIKEFERGVQHRKNETPSHDKIININQFLKKHHPPPSPK
ncbi:MAG: PAC2 family protein [Deltaproteobacteria bacterium]|nr:PAC2 family protein [Deltaproteobacteria bacterium]